MLGMKQERLDSYRVDVPEQHKSFLRADIGALKFAIEVISGARAEDRVVELRDLGRETAEGHE
jgi:hypothetical protein